MKNWISSYENNGDIVLSSRIRLARNLNNIPFPHKLDNTRGKELVGTIEEVFLDVEKDYKSIHLWENSNITNKEYFERHLISSNCIKNKDKSAFIINKDETICLMINEEDHLRIQCINAGYNLEDAFIMANKVDNLLEKKLEYAFDEKLGYLTSCPTNLGTGLRASVMIHLPALSMNNEMSGVLNALSQVGMTIRGLYGEGSEVKGNLYQVSNQITLGLSEEEILNNLKAVISQLITRENIAREKIKNMYKYELEDKVFRSLGILKSAILIDTSESLKLLSDVRLGVEMDIIKDINKVTLNNLLIEIQDATIQKNHEEQLDEKQLNFNRAKLIRENIKNINI